MKIEHVRVIDLTERQLARCKELSFGDEGYMCDDIERIRRDEQRKLRRYSHAILLKYRNRIIGWALVEPLSKSKRWTMQLFVEPIHRRKGYGTILLEESNRYCHKPYAFVDDANASFFVKHRSICTDYEELMT